MYLFTSQKSASIMFWEVETQEIKKTKYKQNKTHLYTETYSNDVQKNNGAKQRHAISFLQITFVFKEDWKNTHKNATYGH